MSYDMLLARREVIGEDKRNGNRRGFDQYIDDRSDFLSNGHGIV